jgi:EAL domain-containing protein (putative c-di-GMP-specific phosphodiesterase class I)
MPGMSGLELLRKVHEIDEGLPVILLTGVPCIDTAAEAVEHGAFSYLLKPVGTDVLMVNIARASQAHGRAREHRCRFEGLEPARQESEAGLLFDEAMESLWLAYQPIVRGSDQMVAGYEALVRSDCPALSEPQAMLAAAERLGSTHRLSRLVRDRAANDLVHAPSSALLFVNLHPHDLLDEELVGSDSPLAMVAPRVVLEITERAGLSTLAELRPRIRQLRSLGFRIAVDDLGAGYSSLNNVAALEPEYMKLDMSLIRDIEISITRRRIVSSVVSLATAMGASVIAEGIETRYECEALLDLGCTLLQGFLFARPERHFPPVDMTSLLPVTGASLCGSCAESRRVPSGIHPVSRGDGQAGLDLEAC